jgi:SNF2 family DNA or RNA helicase
MPIIKTKCPTCKGPAVVSSESVICGLAAKTYQCGHVDIQRQLTPTDFCNFVSSDGKKPYKFQIDSALAAIEANARFLCLHEMGLGKTVIACMTMAAHPEELTKFLVLCKAGLKAQWQKEVPRWCGSDWVPQIIDSESDYLLPGVKGFILSFDMLWRFKDIPAFMKRAKIKFVILDEVQHIKNSDSKRTNGVRAVCKETEHIIGLSGTPIKNHAGEYFPILNIIRPDIFRTKSQFDQVYVDSYWDGYKLKHGGLKNPEYFARITKPFILRYTREQVMPDLPTVSRDYKFSELGPVVEDAYKRTLKEFQDYYSYGGIEDSAIVRSANILAYLSKMRHLTGIAKVEPVVDYVTDFIESTDRKMVIFVHHKDVGAALFERLSALCTANPELWGKAILNIQSVSPEARVAPVESFARPEYRVMIAGELASSEGLNLQMCSDCVLMERQWNPANEEQAEARFIRIGQHATKVSAMYPIAVGTVDEFFSEIVEKKRGICAQVVDGKEYVWQESSLLQELAEVLASTGGKRWGW